MMYSFDPSIRLEPTKRLKGGVIYTNLMLEAVDYVETEKYQAIDFTFVEPDSGASHRERVFPITNTPLIRDKYVGGKKVKETLKDAEARVIREFQTKLLHIATKFVDRSVIEKATQKINQRNPFKDFAIKYIKALGDYSKIPINLKLVYKWNSANTTLPKRPAFIERYEEGKDSTLAFSDWEMANICKPGTSDSDIKSAAAATNTPKIDDALKAMLGE